MLAPPQQCVTKPTLENFPRPLGVGDLMMAERRRRTPEDSDRPPEADLRCLLPSLEVHDHQISLPPSGEGECGALCFFFGEKYSRVVYRAHEDSSRLQPGPPPNTCRVPTSGIPQIIEASSVSARMSSGSRSCTSAFPQARARTWVSRVMAWSRLETRSGAWSTGRRFTSSGSCVVMPTGQRPVWQWWQ